MNEAHILIAAVALGASLVLGFWTGSDTKNDFVPNGVTLVYFLLLVAAILASLVKLVMNAI